MNAPEHPPVGYEDLVLQLGRLSRQVRILRWLTLGAVSLTLVAMALLTRWVIVRNEGRARFQTVEAKNFVVSDERGRDLARFGVDPTGLVRIMLGSDDRNYPGIGMGLVGGGQLVVRPAGGGVTTVVGPGIITIGDPPRAVLTAAGDSCSLFLFGPEKAGRLTPSGWQRDLPRPTGRR